MPEMDGSSNSKPPQLSGMFQKFAVAVKAKTYELFADEEPGEDVYGFSLLDSVEEVITNQKVVVIKPARPYDLSSSLKSAPEKSSDETQLRKPKISSLSPVSSSAQYTSLKSTNPMLIETIISSIFSTISSFEASYLQLQTAHVPFNEECAMTADRALVSHLQRLSDLKHFYLDFRRNADFPVSSCLEAQVQENQSKLRTLGTVSDRLQSEIDQKDSIVSDLRKKLSEIQRSNSKSSMKLSGNSHTSVLLSVRVFDSLLREACRETHKFTKVLMELMNKSGWDINLAANSVHPDILYSKKGNNRYAFLSYVCLGMFSGFDSNGFDLDENDVSCNGIIDEVDGNTNSLQKLLEHVSNPMELLKKNHSSEFSRFCTKKYEELIHHTMESSIFCASDEKDQILNSWRSVGWFNNLFVKMASSIWTLHKLAYSFDPIVEIFRVEKGADFSMVFMEDVTKKYSQTGRTRPKVGYTVVPGFKIGRTMIQSRVYLCPPTNADEGRPENLDH